MDQTGLNASAQQPPSPSIEDPVAQWTIAEKETREAAKWFIVTLGGIAAVVFGAGPIFVQTTYDFASNWPILLIETLAAIAALTAIAYMVKEISNILVPRKIDLDYIKDHPHLSRQFDGAPDIWYPTGIRTFADFRLDLAELREGAAILAAGVAFNESLGSPAGGANDTTASLDSESEAGLRTQRVYLVSFEEAYLAAQNYGKKMVAEAALQALQTRFLVGARLRTATMIAVTATVLFVISLSIKPTEPDAPAPQVAILAKGASQSAEDLWNYFNLQSCESKGVVPVLLLAHEPTGTKVQTIAWNSNCQINTFLVTDDFGGLSMEYSDQLAPMTSPSVIGPPTGVTPTN